MNDAKLRGWVPTDTHQRSLVSFMLLCTSIYSNLRANGRRFGCSPAPHKPPPPFIKSWHFFFNLRDRFLSSMPLNLSGLLGSFLNETISQDFKGGFLFGYGFIKGSGRLWERGVDIFFFDVYLKFGEFVFVDFLGFVLNRSTYKTSF